MKGEVEDYQAYQPLLSLHRMASLRVNSTDLRRFGNS